jgi:hypothetical protein
MWRRRLNGENGLLLTPSVDHLFDRGFISFEDDGKLIVSPVAHRPSLQRMGIDTMHVVEVGGFTSGQKRFLDFHRNAVLLQIRAQLMSTFVGSCAASISMQEATLTPPRHGGARLSARDPKRRTPPTMLPLGDIAVWPRPSVARFATLPAQISEGSEMNIRTRASWALNLASAVASLIAAYFWYTASGALPPMTTYWGGAPPTDAFVVALQQSATSNAWAATFAAVSAALYAAATVVGRLR